MFTADVKVLCEKLDFGFEILREILTTSVLDDEKRLGEILGETRSRAKMKIESAGHSAAVSRATSYFSPTGAFGEQIMKWTNENEWLLRLYQSNYISGWISSFM